MRKLGFSLAAATVAFIAAPANAAVQFQGATGGCFTDSPAPACTPTVGVGGSYAGITYTPGTFNQATSDLDGSLALGGTSDNLGTFTLSGLPFNYNGDLFRLLISFTLPTGTVPNPTTLTAELLGTVTSSENGGVTIDFANNLGNPLFFTSAAGPFSLTVNDVSLSSNSTTQILSGRIVAVPEPGTWAMMLLGFGAIGFATRRRRQSVLPQVA